MPRINATRAEFARKMQAARRELHEKCAADGFDPDNPAEYREWAKRSQDRILESVRAAVAAKAGGSPT